MATDRFAELQLAPGNSAPTENDALLQPEPEIFTPDALRQTACSTDTVIAPLLDEASRMKARFALIDDNLARLQARRTEYFAATYGAGEGLKQEIEDIDAETGRMAASLKKDLDTMDREVSRSLLETGTGVGGGAAVRMRRNIHTALTVKLVNAMGRYQDSQSEFKRSQQKTLRRQLKIANPSLTDDQLEAAVQAGDGQDHIFMQALSSSRHDQAVAALDDVQSKHREILAIERSISELAQVRERCS
jgi:syntaxin 1B/2/3